MAKMEKYRAKQVRSQPHNDLVPAAATACVRVGMCVWIADGQNDQFCGHLADRLTSDMRREHCGNEVLSKMGCFAVTVLLLK